MFNMTDYAQVSGLLEQVAEIEARLSPNERELFHSLKAKYAEPGHTAADDKTCLEVMLRNVRIREAQRPPDRPERHEGGPGDGAAGFIEGLTASSSGSLL